MNENSAAGTTGDSDIYQNFFICLNYEQRQDNYGLYIQYGIQIYSDEISHLYLNYFDIKPLDPVYYSFGSRNSDVQILNARIESFNIKEQIRLRCDNFNSKTNSKIATNCDYECHKACIGCTQPYKRKFCKKCAHASINSTEEGSLFECVETCPNGFQPDLNHPNKLCKEI